MIKNFRFIIMFTAILLAVLMLPSCFAGIGDGALVGGGGYSPIKPNDSVDTTVAVDTTASNQTPGKEALTVSSTIAQLGEIKSCKISLNAGENPRHLRTFYGDEAEEIYRLFSKAKYESAGGRGVNKKNAHIQVHFTDINGGYEIFAVSTNNIYEKENSSTSWSCGKIDGLYNALKGYLE